MNLQEITYKLNHYATHSFLIFGIGIIMFWLAIDLKVGFIGGIIPGMLIGANTKHVYKTISNKFNKKTK